MPRILLPLFYNSMTLLILCGKLNNICNNLHFCIIPIVWWKWTIWIRETPRRSAGHCTMLPFRSGLGLHALNLFAGIGKRVATIQAGKHDLVAVREVRGFGRFTVALKSKLNPAISTADSEIPFAYDPLVEHHSTTLKAPVIRSSLPFSHPCKTLD